MGKAFLFVTGFLVAWVIGWVLRLITTPVVGNVTFVALGAWWYWFGFKIISRRVRSS